MGGTSFDASLTISSIDSPSNFDKNIELEHPTEEVVGIELNSTDISDPNTPLKSLDVTFVSTNCDLNADKTADSLFSEAVETAEFTESPIVKNLENGKASINQFSDPTDALIAKLVSLSKNKRDK